MNWLAMDIGCLECGYPSSPAGLFPTLEAARQVHPDAALYSELKADDWHGSGLTVIYDLSSVTRYGP